MTTTAASGTAGFNYTSLILMVVLLLVMYFVGIRPQRKREKETEKLRNSLQVGDDVITIGGFLGKVTKVNDQTVVIQCGSDKTRLEVAKWAISSKQNLDSKTDKAGEKPEEAPEEPKKPSPKTIKKLGKDEAEQAE